MYRQRHHRKAIKTTLCVAAASLLLLAVYAVARLDAAASRQQTDTPALDNIVDSIPLVETGRTLWYYQDSNTLPPDDTSGLSWQMPNYENLHGWKTAHGSFGSENGQRTDRVNDRYPTNLPAYYTAEDTAIPVYYFRTEFNLNQLFPSWALRGNLQFDDTVVVTLNGMPLYTNNVPDEGFDALGYGAKRPVDSALAQTFTLLDTSALREGKNVLAVELHQASASSSDLYFDFLSLEYVAASATNSERAEGSMVLELGNDESSVRVNWLTEEPGAYTVLYTSMLGDMAQTAAQTLIMEQHTSRESTAYCYTAVLNNLPMDTTYQYRVTTSDGAKSSKLYTYATRDPNLPVSFLLAGDPQIGAGSPDADLAAWSTTMEIAPIINPNADFLICAGDQTDSSDPEDALKETFLFRSPPLLTRLPVLAVKGNHDGDLFDLQFKRSSSTQKSDFFVYGNVLFVRLYTNDKKYEAQRQYLENSILNNPTQWVVVLMHYSMFSTGPHAVEENIITTREEYADTFSRLNVDLVLSGHDHLYSRSYLMQGKTSTGKDGGIKLPGETLYLTASSSTGSKSYDSNMVAYDYLAALRQETEPYLTNLQITQNELRVNTYRVFDRKEIDSCVVTK